MFELLKQVKNNMNFRHQLSRHDDPKLYSRTCCRRQQFSLQVYSPVKKRSEIQSSRTCGWYIHRCYSYCMCRCSIRFGIYVKDIFGLFDCYWRCPHYIQYFACNQLCPLQKKQGFEKITGHRES